LKQTSGWKECWIRNILLKLPNCWRLSLLNQLHLTDFSLHSIGVILYRLKQPQTYLQFIQDVLIDGNVRLLTLPPEAMMELTNAAQQFALDFDDAYQYAASVRHNLILVSLDKDFDRTERGRQMPSEAIREFDVKGEDE
jgi:predicted nucleic acid-binding protein